MYEYKHFFVHFGEIVCKSPWRAKHHTSSTHVLSLCFEAREYTYLVSDCRTYIPVHTHVEKMLSGGGACCGGLNTACATAAQAVINALIWIISSSVFPLTFFALIYSLFTLHMRSPRITKSAYSTKIHHRACDISSILVLRKISSPGRSRAPLASGFTVYRC